MDDSRKKLYDAISSKYDLGTFDEFNSKMDNPNSRSKLYGHISKDFDLGTFDEFDSKMTASPQSDAKKKYAYFSTEDGYWCIRIRIPKIRFRSPIYFK